MSETNAPDTSAQNTNHHSSDLSRHARETAQRVAAGAKEIGQDAAQHYVQEPAKDLISLAKAYAKDHPDVAACWAFGLGIVVGWKLKP
ncbi:hypothetical protein Enr13x_01540 [Stieleria neptunia]|uniref:DUF883 domain-containing protein n=1 Tax=Stieleria neptunia TaxID=2527979 RepID=A0A518HHM9_9BACT|nr:hypothetical protein [Stieleria neptunia]QDV40348.1 hypothetical protein Enr13x_01540 [Stieleria neptunia]